MNDFKAYIEYSNDMDDIYKNIEEYNPNKKRKILVVFDDMPSNKKINARVTKLFITGRKLNISPVWITQFYFAVPRNIRPNSMYYFIMKISNKQELQQISFNYSSDFDFKDLYIKMYCKTIFFFSNWCYSCTS